MKASVCLTVYNEAKGIRRVLNYLSTQNQINEVIVVSDSCKNGTDQILLSWLDHKEHFNKQLITRNKRHGRADAIREALKHSENDLNIIMAGDIKPFRDAIPNIIKVFNDPEVGAATGHPYLLNSYRSIADNLTHLMWTSHDRIGEYTSSRNAFSHLNGEIYGIRKSWLKGFEDYDGLAEDAYIGYLMKQEGHKVVWAKDVRYYMKYPSGFWEWLSVRKRACYGRAELARITNMKDYAFYELAHGAYFIHILRIAFPHPKMLLSLVVGAPTEILCRIYYSGQKLNNKEMLGKLWSPAKQTKW